MKIILLKHAFAIAIIASTMLSCRLFSAAPSVPSAPSIPEGSAVPLFTDDFSNSDSGWETENTPDDTIEYANGGLRIEDWSAEWFAWSNLGDKTFKDIHVEITAKNETQQEGYSFGLMCNRQGENIAFYYFVISASGEYGIGKSLNADEFEFLTNNNQWAESSHIAKDAASYRIGADCGHGTLTLYVDGNKIDSVSDTTFTEGRVGLILWSGEESAGPVTFDDFIITALK
jgi:hypothetical protein